MGTVSEEEEWQEMDGGMADSVKEWFSQNEI